MKRIQGVKVPLTCSEETLRSLLARQMHVSPSDLLSWTPVKKAVDARDKRDVHFVYTFDVTLTPHAEKRVRLTGTVTEVPAPAVLAHLSPVPPADPPVVVGSGPAGLFAVLTLCESGIAPILLERGKDVDSRQQDIERFRTTGQLNTESNVQFGEGGAGTFSDGKLTTGTKSPLIHQVLETFVRFGAPEEILIDSKPHIGTDLLRGVIRSMRREIQRLGGSVCFSTALTGIRRAGRGYDLSLSGGGMLHTDHVLLALGHSARDTLCMLRDFGLIMEQKPFAMGVRIEHPQALINQAQYGAFAAHPALRAADYKLSARTPDGRGCYTFCMCPGGYVMAASSEEGRLCVNGMSEHARDGVNANSALLVGIRPEDFGSDDVLAGMHLQRRIEEAAFQAGGGGYLAPVQRVGDFLSGQATTALGDVLPTYRPGCTLTDISRIFPDFMVNDLRIGLREMGRQLRGFDMPDALLTAPEARSSSPVRLVRGKDGCALGFDGVYPCGEGAGYAGGIMSAAVDGISQARRILERMASA
ncbi:MAG: hypothetical protein IJ246_08685 [Clostridia bacterium]|nr:hypothetical protein [Clostridia bacterium]